MTRRKPKKKLVLNTIRVNNEPLDSQVLPTMYKGNQISRETYVKLSQDIGRKKHRKNVPDLVYESSQAPEKSNTKGWKNVIWVSGQGRSLGLDNSLFKIETESDGYILVQFLNFKIGTDSSIRKGVDHFLKNHHSCQDEPFEDGKMVAAGDRYEARTATFCSYANIKKSCSNFEQQQIEKDCFLAFDDLIRNCSPTFCVDHRTTIKELDKTRNIMKIGKLKLFPTYTASDSLNNSLHVDCNNASRCYAVFYQQHHGIGKSFLVFPKYSLAIECSKCTVLISWEGDRQQHGTLKVENGIHSLFGAGNHVVAKIKQQLYDFGNQPKQCEKALEIGDIVNVRLHQVKDDLAQYDDCYKVRKRNGNLYVIQKAKVIDIVGNSVTIQYIGNYKHKLGYVTVPSTRILPVEKKAK